ncbi:hypothetical protein RFM98_19415 [Mesorhizobium sp. VK9D]|nr:hypothetical protein [Mesorhizobium sp. VK9D]MDX8454937.1 hypothetical protein [Mesorhizobium sp. VK9D]
MADLLVLLAFGNVGAVMRPLVRRGDCVPIQTKKAAPIDQIGTVIDL